MFVGKKIFLVDIDGTLCEDVRNEEGSERMAKAKPFLDSINEMNRLYDESHYICLFTSRTNKHRSVTEEWLKKHGVKFHQIIFNKPRRIGKYTEYHWVDNSHIRATTFKSKFTKFVKKNAEIEVFDE